ncbi:SPOR domain-containing protein [Cellulosimicrobium arenosum]|uniref:SPOR domain-containing protein n=1 Tax=Cellulosimicrobium arenosum TaxID=2708133 RepID=A0A927G6J8_9MICO|nr:SPOR domain-containing protein [Cellulosimicrobium arenosum]MBD8077520.1 SPOR domain-containing protein [Cellulosimicrobium arenosum]
MSTPDTEGSGDDAYYYDTATGEVHQGRAGAWTHRMGPYDTREQAQDALRLARERSDAWDAEDRRERGE